MRVEAFKCDNKNCGNVAYEMETISLGDKKYDLCPKCIKQLRGIIESGFGDNSVEPFHPRAEKSEVIEVKDTADKTEKVKKPSSNNMMSKLDEIGKDVIEREYVEEGMTVLQLANKYGVPKTSMAGYIYTRNIKKKVRQPKTKSEGGV